MKRSNFITRTLRSQRGSFLLSSLAVVLMLSTMIMLNWKSITENQRELDRVEMATSRDLVVASALRLSRVASFYYYSVAENDPVNDMLIKCVIDDGLGDDCIAGASYPLKLVDYDAAATPPYSTITGTATSPAYYSYYGQTCPSLSADCPYEISATFQPNCPAAAAACASAANIDIQVNVSINPAYRSDLLQLADLTSKQTVFIADYQNSYYPVLPPTTPYGTPITWGPGVDGYITKHVLGTAPTGPVAPPPPPPVALPTTISTCAAGEVKGTTCGTFQF